MRHLRIVATVGLLLGVAFLVSQQAGALEESVVLTQKQIDGISESCNDSRYELEQLHASDALIRVNIGKEYANVSSRLMAPLNSRIALNGLDGVELSRITVDYNQAVEDFQQNYLTYEASLSAAIKTDCSENPIDYYSHIKNARRLRADISQSVQEMNSLIGDYQRSFDIFAKDVLEESD